MILIGNRPYRVVICTNRTLKKHIEVTMYYAGGGQSGLDGHHIAGGIWVTGEHPNYKYWENLNVQGISEGGVDARYER